MKDGLAGTLFIVIGSIFFYISTAYKIGTASNIDPGYFPTLVSIILIIIGSIIIIKNLYGHFK